MKIHKIKLKDKITIWLNKIKLKLFSTGWNPSCKDYEFCCIVCGKIHLNVMATEKDASYMFIRENEVKKVKKVYTLDFCSDKCMNKFSQVSNDIELLDFDKITTHLESGYWKDKWTNYWEKSK